VGSFVDIMCAAHYGAKILYLRRRETRANTYLTIYPSQIEYFITVLINSPSLSSLMCLSGQPLINVPAIPVILPGRCEFNLILDVARDGVEAVKVAKKEGYNIILLDG
jgi:hypothetical protein